jgi:uncharacterized protein YfkK (UPF0435 family)
MTNYQALIEKIELLRKTHCPTVRYDFSPSELALIAEALETIQFLEIVFKARVAKN